MLKRQEFDFFVSAEDQSNLRSEIKNFIDAHKQDEVAFVNSGSLSRLSVCLLFVSLLAFMALTNFSAGDNHKLEASLALLNFLFLIILIQSSWTLYKARYQRLDGKRYLFSMDQDHIVSSLNDRLTKTPWANIKRYWLQEAIIILLSDQGHFHFLPVRLLSREQLSEIEMLIFKRSLGLKETDNEEYEADYYLKGKYTKEIRRGRPLGALEGEKILIEADKARAKQASRMVAGFIMILVSIILPFLGLKFSGHIFVFSFLFLFIPGVCMIAVYGFRRLSFKVPVKTKINKNGVDVSIGTAYRQNYPWSAIDRVENNLSVLTFYVRSGKTCPLPVDAIRYANGFKKYANTAHVLKKIENWRG